MPDEAHPRHIVVHDYGMGGLWWWIRAASSADVVEVEVEVGPDGRRLRHVELPPDGPGVRSDESPIDPPVDLHDPRYVPMEIDARTFEDGWRAARAC